MFGVGRRRDGCAGFHPFVLAVYRFILAMGDVSDELFVVVHSFVELLLRLCEEEMKCD